MKIAIIGAGWVGCHLAKTLLNEHEITIYEKDDIFSSTSFFNQNRLHLGFHYPRNQRTRILCKDTFSKFMSDYGDFVNDVPINVYSVPNLSVIDYNTYISIFDYEKTDFSNIKLDSVKNIENSIIVNEKHINYRGLKTYFKELLDSKILKNEIEDVNQLTNNYDFVINCTNNFLNKNTENSFYEVSLCLIYEKINETEFDALTLVDGNFFSIYPYYDNFYTISDVEYTPLITNESLDTILNYKNNINMNIIDEKKIKIENKILNYFPEFKEKFKYDNFFTSIKSKTLNGSADRYPIINQDKNIINCFTGKIQGIYIIEENVKKIINYDSTRT